MFATFSHMRIVLLVVFALAACRSASAPRPRSPDSDPVVPTAPPDEDAPSEQEPAAPLDDEAEFQLLPPLDQLALENLGSPNAASFLQLRQTWGQYDAPYYTQDEAARSYGVACLGASDPAACAATLAALHEEAGFQRGCLPAYCAWYVVGTRSDEIFSLTNKDELLAFFGTVDTPEEAAYVAAAHDYWFGGGDVKDSAYKAIPGGYRLIVTRLTAHCAPIITTRYLLDVKNDGTLTVLKSEEAYREENACI